MKEREVVKNSKGGSDIPEGGGGGGNSGSVGGGTRGKPKTKSTDQPREIAVFVKRDGV